MKLYCKRKIVLIGKKLPEIRRKVRRFILGSFSLMIFLVGSDMAVSQLSEEAKDLSGRLDEVFNSSGISNWGIIVQAENGETLYSRNADKALIPASNLKIFTIGTALVKLSPDFRFITKVYYQGHIDKKGILKGDLKIQGEGDPTISGRFNDGRITKTLEDWADSLIAVGVTKIEGRIIGDDSYFDGEALGQGWSPDYQTEWYAAQISALSLNDNCIDLTISAGSREGKPLEVNYEPKADIIQIINKGKTGGENSFPNVRISREDNVIKIKGKLPLGTNQLRWITVDNPTLFTVSAFKEVLARKGITVTKGVIAIDYLPVSERKDWWEWKLIATSQSHPLSDIIKVTNKNSQNFYAEQLLKTLGAEIGGYGSRRRGIKIVKQFMEEIGIDTKDFSMVDGCGLSPLNLVTPHQIVNFLRYMRKYPNFYDSFPMAGIDGSLRNRMVNTAATGNARAKTGSIDGVRALSGYVTTKNGQLLIFSMIANGSSEQVSWHMTNAQDRACEIMAGYWENQGMGGGGQTK